MSNEGKRFWKVGTRGSKLALVQKDIVCDLIRVSDKDVDLETIIIKTTGDMVINISIPEIGRPGVFSEELADALINNKLDMVVHSMKDLPTKLSEETVITVIPERMDPRDICILAPKYKNLSELPVNGVVGTSSPRRIAQLKYMYPHLQIKNIRGNIETRIKKLNDGNDYDAIILAIAGINRLGLNGIKIDMLAENFLYAVGQGALAVQCKKNQTDMINILSQLTHVETALSCICEREILKTLGGGCCVPIGVETKVVNDMFCVTCGVFSLDGTTFIIKNHEEHLPSYSIENEPPYFVVGDISISSFSYQAALMCANIGRRVAELLIDSGAHSIINNIRHTCEYKPTERIVSLDKKIF